MCMIEGCSRPLFAAGYCGPHYKRKWRYGDPLAGAAFRDEPLSRLRALSEEDENGCWIWTGCTDRLGYGTAWWNGSTERAHRAVFFAAGREIPAGTELDHLCRVRACVNPDHLEAVTHQENVRRGWAARRGER